MAPRLRLRLAHGPHLPARERVGYHHTRLGFVIVTRFIREQRYSRIIVSMVPLGTPSRPLHPFSRQRNCHSDWGRHGNCACHTEDRDPSRDKRRDTLYLRAKRIICIWTRARAIESLFDEFVERVSPRAPPPSRLAPPRLPVPRDEHSRDAPHDTVQTPFKSVTDGVSPRCWGHRSYRSGEIHRTQPQRFNSSRGARRISPLLKRVPGHQGGVHTRIETASKRGFVSTTRTATNSVSVRSEPSA